VTPHASAPHFPQKGGSCHYKVNAVLEEPVKRLDQEKNRKEPNKPGIKVVPKEGHGEAGLSEGQPGLLIHVLREKWMKMRGE